MKLFEIIFIITIGLNQPNEDLLKKGIYFFEHQDFKQSITIFSKIINNNLVKDENELAECYKYLGAAYFYIEDHKAAEANFRQLLFLKPDARLDPFLFPPSMVLFFDKIKNEMTGEKKVTSTELNQHKSNYHIYVNFLPFGLPQYANNQNVKGSFIFITQLASLGTNIYSYWNVQSMLDRYGYVKDQETADKANLFKTIQITSLILFGLIYTYSIVDGFYYSPSTKKEGR
ncbi:MAG: tetratricopeptide repeat protein [Deltaproteobacteria bacterium]|nr:tetratricopeptide repeat protein [Deltaproteobacteria bacterium]